MAISDSTKPTEEKPPPEPARLDGGKRAWLFLIAAVVIEGMLYGNSSLSLESFYLVRIGADFFLSRKGFWQTTASSSNTTRRTRASGAIPSCRSSGRWGWYVVLFGLVDFLGVIDNEEPGHREAPLARVDVPHHQIPALPAAHDLGRMDPVHRVPRRQQLRDGALEPGSQPGRGVQRRLLGAVLSPADHPERVVGGAAGVCLWGAVSLFLSRSLMLRF